jgi:hypothetical protein
MIGARTKESSEEYEGPIGVRTRAQEWSAMVINDHEDAEREENKQ